MRLAWEDDKAEGPGGRVYLLDEERIRGAPAAWSVLVTGEGRRSHRQIRPEEPPWPTKARAKRAAQLDAEHVEAIFER